jgi:hypothetical protein
VEELVIDLYKNESWPFICEKCHSLIQFQMMDFEAFSLWNQRFDFSSTRTFN